MGALPKTDSKSGNMSTSLVGNTTVNYDRTGAMAGADTGSPMPRRPSQAEGFDFNPMKLVRTISRSASKEQTNADSKQNPDPSSLDEKLLSSEDESERRDEQVLQLARRYTTVSQHDQNPFSPEKDSHLDPWSTNFKPRSWAKALLSLQHQEPDKHKPRTAGIAFKDLNVYGYGQSTDYQKTVGNAFFQVWGWMKMLVGQKGRRIDILRHLDGVVHAGEMLVVLGPPGSGCSTFLKTVAQDTHGFYIDDKSYLNYQGVSAKQMSKNFRGEVIYTAEIDVHFPMLSVGDTLGFAARARAPRNIPGGVSRTLYCQYQRDVIMAMFGIGHTINTRVGNDFVRGVSGGERKRVTIAEAALSGAPLQCWDNSTRGLDSANAIEFCKTLRMQSDLMGTTSAVAIYQAPQSAYEIFDKVLLLYEGRQIFFGPAGAASDYFIRMGFYKEDRATDADFLTSMTASDERIPRDGFEDRVPRTPDEFAQRWQDSPEYSSLQKDLEQYGKDYEVGGEHLQKFKESRRSQQARVQRVGSPYTLSYWGQIDLCLRRGFQRLRGDPFITLFQLFGNLAMALIVASVFYNLPTTTDSFFSRGALIFFAILLNAFGSALEILTLYAQRPIVEKQSRYAFYHPSAEAFASMLTDMPYKILNTFIFNSTLYWMTGLRRDVGAFFFFMFVSFILTLVMSMLFRFIASVSRTLSQALTPTAILILAIIMFTGFAIPVPYMLGWSRWINYLDPVAYGFESLMINEFAGTLYDCSSFVPSRSLPQYANVPADSTICSVTGARAGATIVQGTDFITTTYQYDPSNKWFNIGILFVFMVGLGVLYLIAAELVTSKKSKGEVLVFRRGHTPAVIARNSPDDVEAATGRSKNELSLQKTDASHIIERQTAIFHWRNVCFDIKVKGGERRLLDHIDGWVKPGTLTALMGVSGAGKTTLLDVLATRTTIGVISGDMLVDGRQRDESFQRKTGYVQQQDLHLPSSTVREALNFSAILRQPAHVSRQEKMDYVNDVIKLLDMEEYADAVVGVPGEGLNVEQRKRLTIGVELAAKPALLLFLDEPTSGLDSQTSWAILDLMEKLTKNGQAVLCTIHQPSAVLFQRFDRLLFLQRGGQTVYFGEIGENSNVLIKYFEGNGVKPCPKEANPAEWMLEVIGAAPGTHSDTDWFKTWRESPEYQKVHEELDDLEENRPKETDPASNPDDKESYREFAAPFWEQYVEVQKRVFQQYWRTPSYIYAKLTLTTLAPLFIGFSFFQAGTTQQALQNQLFSIFLLFTIFGQIIQQIQPNFVTQRALYEARERPSKAYSWKAFMISSIIVELPWAAVCSILIFVCWYYPVGMYKNAEFHPPFNNTNEVHFRGFLMFLFVLQFMLFASTFAIMLIAAIETAEGAGNLGNLMFSLSLIFCGVLATPSTFPKFWIFMYRVSPFRYLVEGFLGVALANNAVVCSDTELLHFTPPAGMNCNNYMQSYIDIAQGYLVNGNSTTECSYCTLSSTNQFLLSFTIDYNNKWLDFGILWVYIVFNLFAGVFLYWFGRVPKKSKRAKKAKKE